MQYLSDLYTDRELGRWLGINSAVIAIASIVFPPIGAWILVQYNWRSNFLLVTALSAFLLVLFYLHLPETLDKTKKTSGLSLAILGKEGAFLIKKPIFALACLMPALYASVTLLFDFFIPFFYMDVCHFTPYSFSLIRVSFTLVGILGSFAYVYVLQHYGETKALTYGIFIYLPYTLGVGLFLASNDINYPYLLMILAVFQILSAAFINPLGMLKAISASNGMKSVGLSVFALTRNIFSAVLSFYALLFFNGSFYSILVLILILSLVIMGGVVLMRHYMCLAGNRSNIKWV